MPDAVILGAPGTSGERLARRLADALRAPCAVGGAEPASGVWLTWPPSAAVSQAALAAFIDDNAKEHAAQRAAALATLARARIAGRHIRVFLSDKPANRWAGDLADSGLPEPQGPIRRLYLAAGESEASTELAKRLAEHLGLPLLQPEAEHPGHDYEGWGPRYEGLARGESWLIHSPTWHAVEALTQAADLVLLIERKHGDPREEFPSPLPAARKWQRIFAPWLNRYPDVEARLLEREVERRAGHAPVLRIRTPEERAAVVEAFAALTPTGGDR